MRRAHTSKAAAGPRRPPRVTRRLAWALLAGGLGLAAPAAAGPADRIVASIPDASLRALLEEALAGNPGLAAAAARARAAREQAPQAGALPDPVASATAYLAPPETRVGPQRLVATLSQRLPWFGKRSLREQAALRHADALGADVEARRLELVTEVRRLFAEIAFLDARRDVVLSDRATLARFEEMARARYASGAGAERGVVRIQAEITRDDSRLLDIANRRASLVAELNALVDRPAGTPVPPLRPDPSPAAEIPPSAALRARAREARPELARASAEVERADALLDLARKESAPDLTLGVAYGAVCSLADAAGLLQPPPDNGADVFGLSASLNLPLWRGRIRAGVAEAAETRDAAAAGRRDVTAAVDRALDDFAERLRIAQEQVELFERVLLVQAEQSLRSVEAGYAAGGTGSLDLLDAERVLLDVHTGLERARADRAVARARLEGALGGPLGGEVEGGGR